MRFEDGIERRGPVSTERTRDHHRRSLPERFSTHHRRKTPYCVIASSSGMVCDPEGKRARSCTTQTLIPFPEQACKINKNSKHAGNFIIDLGLTPNKSCPGVQKSQVQLRSHRAVKKRRQPATRYQGPVQGANTPRDFSQGIDNARPQVSSDVIPG